MTAAEFDKMREDLLSCTRVGSAAYRALTLQSGELVTSAASIKGGQSCVVITRKYGNKPGIRTVIVDESVEPTVLVHDMFSPLIPVSEPTTTSHKPPSDGSRSSLAPRPVLDAIAPASFRLLDSEHRTIADNIVSGSWARRMAASLTEFGPITLQTWRGSRLVRSVTL